MTARDPTIREASVNEGRAGGGAPQSGIPADSSGSASARVFVSYRREDVPDATDRLTGSLRERLGRDRVFVDIDSIEIGADFADVIGKWIARCDVLLAVIGHDWADASDRDGKRRLDDPRDYVRLEIEAALAREVRVVPVLIHGATLPRAGELPSSIAPMLHRNALELTRKYWSMDVDELLRGLERLAQDKRQPEPAGAAPAAATAASPSMAATAGSPPAAATAASPSTAVVAAPPSAADQRSWPRDLKARTLAIAAALVVGAVVVVIGVTSLGGGSSSGSRNGNPLNATSPAASSPSPGLTSQSTDTTPQSATATAQPQRRLSPGQCTGATADCTNANLSGANFKGASLEIVDFQGSDLSHADFSHAQLGQSNFSATSLVGANLSGADLGQAQLTGANLQGADLSGAKLGQADLSNSNLCGANLNNVDIQQADTTNARCAPG